MFSVDLSTRPGEGYVVVELRGELDVADAAAVAATIAAMAVREPEIIVDLAALEFIDSSGVVTALGHERRQARRAGGDLLLAAPEPGVLRTLTTTRLIDAFSVHASVAASGSGSARPQAGQAEG
jgi:anti-anti-sigma factor